MGNYHLDEAIERRHTASVKWDGQARQFHSNDLTPFWIADMDFAVAPCITEALEERVRHPVYGYSMLPAGYHDAICSWYERRHGILVKPEWILPSGHAVTTLAMAVQAVTKPGEACLILTPAYDPFFQIVRGCGRDILTLQLTERDGHYQVDLPALERCFAAGVHCLIFCNPHNPVGKAWKRQELQDIARLCKQYEVTVLSDEVHGDWVFAPWGYTSFLSVPEVAEQVILITSPSKTFNLAGFSVSNLMIPGEALRERMKEQLSSMFVKGPNFLGAIAAKAAYAGGEDWVDEVRSYVAQNGRYFRERIENQAPGLRIFDQEGTFLLWIDCRQAEPDSGRVCESLARDYGISVGNGAAYGKGGAGFIRVNIGCPRCQAEVCADSLIRWYSDRIGRERRRDEDA